MAESKKSGFNPFDDHYTNFEQSLALSWAQAHLVDYLRTHPDSSPDEQSRHFLDALDDGLYIISDFRNRLGR